MSENMYVMLSLWVRVWCFSYLFIFLTWYVKSVSILTYLLGFCRQKLIENEEDAGKGFILSSVESGLIFIFLPPIE